MAQHSLDIVIARYERKNLSFDSFMVNKRPLAQRLRTENDVTPFGWVSPEFVCDAEFEKEYAERLLGLRESNVRPGRMPLFICGFCGDIGCGATTCEVEISEDLVEWRNFGWDVDYEEETVFPDNLLGHHFYFDREDYERLFRRYTNQ